MQTYPKKYLIAISVGISIALTIFAIIAFTQPNYVVGEQVTKEGQVVCLPHKKGIFGSVETSECMTGFHATDGKYYAVRIPESTLKENQIVVEWFTRVSNEGTKVKIFGTFVDMDQHYEPYDVSGVIAINNLVLLEKFQEPKPYVNITIYGLKENYEIDEPIRFGVKVDGYPIPCGKFEASIYNESDEQQEWSNEWIDEQNCSRILPFAFDYTFPMENDKRYFTTAIDTAGYYGVRVSFDDKMTAETIVEERFTVRE